MDGLKYVVFRYKSIQLLGKIQYTSNVESGSTRTKIKHWVEMFFGVKVTTMNSHRLLTDVRSLHFKWVFYSTSKKEKNLNQNA